MSDDVEVSRALRAAFAATPEATLGVRGVRFRRVGGPGPLPDSTSKFLGEDLRGVPTAFAVVSAAKAPSLVTRANERARRIVMRTGAELGRAVLLPIAEGKLDDGRSWAISRYCSPLPEGRLARRAMRTVLRPNLLRWLAGVTAVTGRAVDNEGIAVLSERLRTFLDFPRLPRCIAEATRVALMRLDAGSFSPFHVVTHGDCWLGNILLPRDPAHLPRLQDFVLIDWAGAHEDGHPLLDLVRVATDFRMPAVSLRREIEHHMRLLGQSADDAAAHLASAFALSADRLEYFPPEAFLQLALRGFETLARTGLSVPRPG